MSPGEQQRDDSKVLSGALCFWFLGDVIRQSPSPSPSPSHSPSPSPSHGVTTRPRVTQRNPTFLCSSSIAHLQHRPPAASPTCSIPHLQHPPPAASPTCSIAHLQHRGVGHGGVDTELRSLQAARPEEKGVDAALQINQTDWLPTPQSQPFVSVARASSLPSAPQRDGRSTRKRREEHHKETGGAPERDGRSTTERTGVILLSETNSISQAQCQLCCAGASCGGAYLCGVVSTFGENQGHKTQGLRGPEPPETSSPLTLDR
ncbi:hypothetical protein EYF80_061724 [Liparis tanakae]|uniref:Uncharacterized protein n=1 Tax=Liparis tanakae TaxID=230148 RepID=A0A4Z2EH78_9TELE|nr:hypothetical protein EYF80_061724 [Liparis tanakae]